MGQLPPARLWKCEMGPQGKSWFWRPTFPRKWLQHYLSLRFLVLVIWAHFLVMRPEYTAICTWLLCETLNVQSSTGEPERISKEDLLHVFKAHILWALKLELNLSSNLSDTAAHLPLPLCSLWENRNVKCRASAASGKTHCLQTHSKILVLTRLGAWLWRNHRDWQLELEMQALPWFAFFLLDALRASRSLFCPVHQRASVYPEHQAFRSSAVWQCIFLTIRFSFGAGGKEHQYPSRVLTLQWRHCMLFSLLYTWPAHARKGGMFNTP